MKRSAVTDILPLAPFQEGLLFHALYDDQGPDVYAVQVIAELEGELDAVALRSACQALLRRHANLRACFRYTSSGTAVQVIPQGAEAPWAEHDLSALGEAEQAAERERILEQDRMRRFDLGRPPLIRFALLSLGVRRHVFMLTNHHILLDGWSLSMLLRDLFTLYANAGSDAGMLPVAPYRDYLAWLSAQDGAAARDAWRTALAGIDGPTRLTREDFTGRPPVMPEAVIIEMPASETAELTAWARRTQLTLSTIVQGCWAVLLGSLTGSDDVVFGATVAGRPAQLPDVESMIGLFINTLPVRARLSPGRSLADFLGALQEWNISLLSHQHIGLGEVQQLAETGTSTLFDTVMVFENYPLDAAGLQELAGGLRVIAAQGLDASHYPVNIRVVPGSRLRFRVEYRPDLLRREQVQEIADGLVHLLSQVVTQADRPLATLRPGGQVTAGVLVGQEGEVAGGVVERVCAVAETAGGSAAVVDEAGAVSYAGLVSWAAVLAGRLDGVGVGPGCLVAVVAAPGAVFVGSVLGVLWSGAGFVPVDVQAPAGRTAGMLADAGVSAVVAAPEWAELAAGLATTAGAVVVAADWPFADPSTAERTAGSTADGTRQPAIRGTLRDVAYVIFTSGSTGRPKGAMVARRGLVNHLLAKVGEFGLTGADCVVANAPVTFDVSVWQMLAALLVGGRVRVVRWEVAADPARLFAMVAAERVTVLEVVPSVLRAALDAWDTTPALAAVGVPDLGEMRWLMVTGEALPREVCLRWFGVYPQVPVANVYGPTECSDDVTHAVLRGPADVAGPRVPIGLPVRNTRLYVLGDGLCPVPTRVVGELYVGGAGVGVGYVRDPARTAAVFVADPFGSAGTRMYRTGDRVAARADGQLEFVDRRDQQVKVRGHRIELGEVEAALRAVAGVAAAAAAVTPGPGGQTQLVGYLVLAAGQAVAGVRAALAAQLPGHLIPTAWAVLDALPLTPHGKTDRAALPAPTVGGVGSGGGRAARTPHEQLICDVFAHVLGLPRIAATDSFFELGGHSLLATRAITRLRSLTGADLPVRALFDARTPAALAPALTAALAAGSTGGDRPPLVPGPRPHLLPLSAGQQRLWFLNQLDGPSATYNLPVAVRLHHIPDPVALAAALADLTARHESLRTIYPETNGTPYQQILSTAEVQPHLDHTHLLAQQLTAALTRAATQGFDLSTQPPLRAYLFTITPAADGQVAGAGQAGGDGEGEHVLLLVLHHIAADGWSAGPLASDLATAYAARLAGHAPVWQPLPAQYADYTLWQQQLLGDLADPASRAALQLGYWQQALAGLPDELRLPTDRPRPARASFRGGQAAIAIPAATHAELAALARQHGATLFMAIHAALAALLTRLGAGTDIPIGTPIAGRTDEALDDLVGFFVNTLVLRTDTSGDPTFSTLLHRARDTGLAAHAHQDLPFERIVDDLRPARSLARQPLVQIMLAFQNTAPPPVTPALSDTPLSVSTSTAKFDLLFELAEQHTPAGEPAGIHGHLEYATDLFDPSAAEALATRLIRLLDAAAAAPATRLSQLPLLVPAERHQILHDWVTSPGASPGTGIPSAGVTITDLFQAQAAANPSRAALSYIHDDTTVHISYQQLNRSANKLAHHLVAHHHVGPEKLVALALPRTPDFVVAILAVLKAGAAYLPLDPGYPAERVAAMLEDGRPALVLTSADWPNPLPPDVPAVSLSDPSVNRAVGRCRQTDPAVKVSPDHPAYVIYTSGSTGRPKGVVITHRNVTRLFKMNERWFDFGVDDVWTLFHSFAFDFSVWELWGALLYGGRVVLVPYAISRSPEEFLALLASERVTVLSQTPSAFYQLMQADRQAAATVAGGPELALRYVIFGGESLELGRLTDWYSRHAADAPTLVNMYGITETTVHVTYLALDEPDAMARKGSLIGAGIPDLRVYVLDDTLQPVPAGVVGEIYVAGAGLSRGYLNRTPLTAQRFVADPFGAPGTRMYRSGDLGRWHGDGRLEHLGRGDQQVQLRGFRIELGEVETALARHRAIAQVAVIARDDRPGDLRLVAYVVPAGGAVLDTAELRRFAAGALPDYMLPATVVTLDALPVTQNGKLDRRALPAPDPSAPGASRRPRTPHETVLCGLFGEVLGLEQVGIDQDFFLLGGSSLLAARLTSRVRSALGAELTIRDLFEAPNVADLAVRLDNRGEDESFDTLVPLRRGGERPAVFCLHPSGGIAWMYIGLAPYLDPAYPIYGLQAQGIVKPAELPETIEAMASGYVRHIQEAQPSGPYFLVGWSFGGALAHEVAVQLQEQGEEVALLAVLDTFPPSCAEEVLDEQRVLREFLGRLGHEIPDRDLAPAELAAVLQQFSNPLSGFDESQISNLLNVWRHNISLYQRFRPRRYTGKMVLFTATVGRTSESPDAQSWCAHVDGSIESHDIDCAHDDMMEETPMRTIGRVIAIEVELAHRACIALLPAHVPRI
ncbi:MAG TPA: amino acid adenylation domain-containing protein [Streptosporangiaceae bacterium]|nr:amino acid adenylation domain-containing protein [Streptosporangiaceae bacterium]